MSQRVLVVADVSNLYYTIKKKFKQQKLHYRKFLAKAVGNQELYRAYAYAAQMNDEAEKFLGCLKHFGFDLQIKKPSEYTTKEEGQDVKIRKADWDVGIAIDVVRCLDKVDHVIIGSADGDMVPLVSYIRERGARCSILACGINNSLKESADAFWEIGPELLETKQEREQTELERQAEEAKKMENDVV